jgi:hypothetical protein
MWDIWSHGTVSNLEITHPSVQSRHDIPESVQKWLYNMNILGRPFQTLQISVYCNPTTCLYILRHKRYIYHIVGQDVLLLCNHFKSVTTNILHQWWQQMVNHLYQIRAVLVILQSSLITKLHTTYSGSWCVVWNRLNSVQYIYVRTKEYKHWSTIIKETCDY